MFVSLSVHYRGDLASLIEKLQKNADKVEKNILETEQNLNKVILVTQLP